jgi:Fe-S-cluster containining protein
MHRKAAHHKRLGIHHPRLCKDCAVGACCREGVEVDLFEVSRILKKVSLDIAQPWFYYLRRDKSFPSGFVFSTFLRDGRCVFQADDRRCRVYALRPRFCKEFPLENGGKAPEYHRLCQHGRRHRKKT